MTVMTRTKHKHETVWSPSRRMFLCDDCGIPRPDPDAPKVKVRCSEIRVCGWSGERRDPGPMGDVTGKPCPRCLRRSVERVGRTNPNRY